MINAEKAASIQGGERVLSLDVLRGFALFGILMVNILDFSGPVLYRPSIIHSEEWGDRFVEILVFLFAQASFYPLFSFLFGAGSVMFYKRLEEKGRPAERYFARRLTGLLIIGILHAFLIWHGDILISYALIGFLFMLFVRMRSGALALWSMCLILIPSFLMAMLLGAAGEMQGQEADLNPVTERYQNGSFAEIMEQRAADYFYVNNPFGAPFLVLSILPMFLLGAAAMKKGWFRQEPPLHLYRIWLAAAAVCGPSALVLKSMPLILPGNGAWLYLHQSVGGPLLSFFYITVILLAVSRYPGLWIYRKLAFAGRVSMSNYLLQSVICTFIFYSYGLGLYGRVSSLQAIFTGIAVYVLLAAVSSLWFKHYRQGPAEKAWRWFVYRRE